MRKSCKRAFEKLKIHESPDLKSTNAFISSPFAVTRPPNPKRCTPVSSEPPWDFLAVAVKDNIATSSEKTTCASGILQNYQSPYEATVVTKLTQWRSVVIGKTNMDEFGMGSHSTNSFFGPVLSPDTKRSAGGSSGGSAVAVMTGQATIALGTDTGGSVRLPAAYTGTVGFKPSYGLISRHGVVPYANSLDTVGIIAQTTDLLPAVLQCIAGHDAKDPTSLTEQCRARIGRRKEACPARDTLDPTRIKIGVPLEYNIQELQPAIRSAWKAALELLQTAGCSIVPVSLPSTKHALSAYYVLAAAEASSNLAKYDGIRYGARSPSSAASSAVLYSSTRGAGFGPEVKRRILLGSYTLSSEAVDNYFIQAQKVRRLVQRDFDRVFALPNGLRDDEQFDLSDLHASVAMASKRGPAQVDFLVCPTAPTVPPALRELAAHASPVEAYMNDVLTVPASLAGLPAISVPFAVETDGLEGGEARVERGVGIQIIGQFADDERVIALAGLLEGLQRGDGSR